MRASPTPNRYSFSDLVREHEMRLASPRAGIVHSTDSLNCLETRENGAVRIWSEYDSVNPALMVRGASRIEIETRVFTATIHKNYGYRCDVPAEYDRLVLMAKRSGAEFSTSIVPQFVHGDGPRFFEVHDRDAPIGWFKGDAVGALVPYLLNRRLETDEKLTSFGLELWLSNHPMTQGPFSNDPLPNRTELADGRFVIHAEREDVDNPGVTRSEIRMPGGLVTVHRNYGPGQGIDRVSSTFDRMEVQTERGATQVTLAPVVADGSMSPGFRARHNNTLLGVCRGAIDYKLAAVLLATKIDPLRRGTIPLKLKKFLERTLAGE